MYTYLKLLLFLLPAFNKIVVKFAGNLTLDTFVFDVNFTVKLILTNNNLFGSDKHWLHKKMQFKVYS